MEASNNTVSTFKKMFELGKRFDGRGLLDHRELSVEFDISKKAEGSARVKLGKTEVIAGVKLSPGEPYPDSLDKGNLVITSEFLPLASPRFDQGPPQFDAIELGRLMDRAIRESGMIQLDKLVITPGEKVWNVYIDIYPINDDGNLIEAAGIACIAALKKAKVPEIDKNGKVDYDSKSTKKFPLLEGTTPITFGFYKLGKTIIMDPTREEEEVCDVRVAFGVSEWNGDLMINSCQKSGPVAFSEEEIEKIMELLPKKFEEDNKKLKKLF
jgi:exosome complex component RRP42